MPTYYIVDFEGPAIEAKGRDKRSALLAWADKHGHEAYDALYGWDDGQLDVMTEKEHREWEKENKKEAITK